MSSLRDQKQVSMMNAADPKRSENLSFDGKQVVSSVNLSTQRLPDPSPMYPSPPDPTVYTYPPFNYVGFPYQPPAETIDAMRNPDPHGLTILPNNYNSGGDIRPIQPLPPPNSFVQQSSSPFYYPIPVPPQFHHAEIERNSHIDKWFDPEVIRSMQRGGHFPPSHQSSSGQTRLLMAEDLERERLHHSSGRGV